MERIQVNLYDTAPRIGSGWRIVEVLTVGWKWVTIRYEPKSIHDGSSIVKIRSRIGKRIWNTLPKKEIQIGNG